MSVHTAAATHDHPSAHEGCPDQVSDVAFL